MTPRERLHIDDLAQDDGDDDDDDDDRGVDDEGDDDKDHVVDFGEGGDILADLYRWWWRLGWDSADVSFPTRRRTLESKSTVQPRSLNTETFFLFFDVFFRRGTQGIQKSYIQI